MNISGRFFKYADDLSCNRDCKGARQKERTIDDISYIKRLTDSISIPVALILIVLAVSLMCPISPATVTFTGIL